MGSFLLKYIKLICLKINVLEEIVIKEKEASQQSREELTPNTLMIHQITESSDKYGEWTKKNLAPRCMLWTNHAVLSKHIKIKGGKTPFNTEEKGEASESFFFFSKSIKKSAKKLF